MGQHVCQRENTLPAEKCLLTPLLFETSTFQTSDAVSPQGAKVFIPDEFIAPPLGLRPYQFLGLYLKGNLFEEKTNNKRARSETVLFSLAASLNPFSLLLKLPCLSGRARTQARMANSKRVGAS